MLIYQEFPFSMPSFSTHLTRLLQGLFTLLLTLFGLLLVTFSFSALSPVDRVLQIVGDHASQSTYDQVRHQLGLDQPLPVQFWHYLVNLAHGDLGIASATGQPVLHDLLAVFPATLELATLALIVGAVLGIVAGVLCARYAGSPWDLAVRTFTLLGNSVPIFWLGLLMLALFYARLQWAPGPGRLDDIYQYTVEPRSGFALIDTWLSGDTAAFKNAIGHLALPVLVLAYYSLASITRLTRSACLSEMNKEYILLARAKGAGEMTILLRHVLPNIRGTLLTVTALAWTSMLEGAVLTETVFSWPGIGRYLTTALFAGDTTAIMGGTLLIGVSFVLINNLTDLLVRLTDPSALMPTYLFLRRLRRSPAAFSGLTLVILLVLTALFAPWLAPHDPNWQDAAARLQGPGAGHWLGTDSYGRDLLSRLLYGARPALGLVALVTAITLPVGLLVGILSGYYGGWLERILMRFTDVVMSMPRLILAFAFVAMLGPGLVNGALALALTTWPAYARQARSEIQRLRHSDYLAAAEMLGIRGGRLLVGHILPLCLPSAIVRLALDLAGIILAAAGLGFLGLGARPPMAEWGAMIADGMQVIFDQWWIAAIPGAAILLASLAFNLLGDGLRDILEPQHD